MKFNPVYEMVHASVNTTNNYSWGWSGGAKVLGKLPVPGRPTILITVGKGLLHLQ